VTALVLFWKQRALRHGHIKSLFQSWIAKQPVNIPSNGRILAAQDGWYSPEQEHSIRDSRSKQFPCATRQEEQTPLFKMGSPFADSDQKHCATFQCLHKADQTTHFANIRCIATEIRIATSAGGLGNMMARISRTAKDPTGETISQKN